MATGKLIDAERVACEVCLKEIPKSEAKSPEGTEYVLYFCGLDCYQKWESVQSERGGEDGSGRATA